MRFLSLLAIVGLLSGCSLFESEIKESPIMAPVTPPAENSELDELLIFGADLAGKSVAARAEACHSLLKRQKESPMASLQMQLSIGRQLSDACGDIPKIIEGVAGVIKDYQADEALQNFLTIQIEALKHLNAQSKKLGLLERRQKNLKTLIESKEHAITKTQESHLLRDKLKAIRVMEKQMDDGSEGN